MKNLDTYFKLARATEEKIQQMADKVQTTDKEREKSYQGNYGGNEKAGRDRKR